MGSVRRMLSIAARSMARVSARNAAHTALPAARHMCSSETSSSSSSSGSSGDAWQRSAMTGGGLDGNAPKKYRGNFDRIFGKKEPDVAPAATTADVAPPAATTSDLQATIDKQAGQIVSLTSEVADLQQTLDAAQSTLLAFAEASKLSNN